MEKRTRKPRVVNPEDAKNIRAIMSHLLLHGPQDSIPTEKDAISWALREATKIQLPNSAEARKQKVG